jgi:hypothetical protein
MTTGNTWSEESLPDKDFFPHVNNIFNDMADNTNANANGSAPAAAPYVFLSSILKIMLEFLVLAIGLEM